MGSNPIYVRLLEALPGDSDEESDSEGGLLNPSSISLLSRRTGRTDVEQHSSTEVPREPTERVPKGAAPPSPNPQSPDPGSPFPPNPDPFPAFPPSPLSSDLPIGDPPNYEARTERTVKIHRANIREEMVKTFRDPSILSSDLKVKMIDLMGIEEKGSGSVVLREVVCLFWKEAYNSFMVGVDERVPFICHDFTREKWEAVARILIMGFNECSYFPLQLCKSFFAAALFWEKQIPSAILIQEIGSEDTDVMEFLSNFDCRRLVTNSNIKDVLQ